MSPDRERRRPCGAERDGARRRPLPAHALGLARGRLCAPHLARFPPFHTHTHPNCHTDTGAAAPAPSRVVFVGNLPADVSDDDVRSAFASYTVTAVDLKKLSRPP